MDVVISTTHLNNNQKCTKKISLKLKYLPPLLTYIGYMGTRSKYKPISCKCGTNHTRDYGRSVNVLLVNLFDKEL